MNQADPRPTATPNPKQRFASPEILMADKNLSAADKRKLLEHWKQDLTLELTATQENMPVQQADGTPAPTNGDTADLLQRVSDCLRHATEEEQPRKSKAAAGKHH